MMPTLRQGVTCSQPGCRRLADIDTAGSLLSLPAGWVQHWAPGGKYEYFCPDHRPLHEFSPEEFRKDLRGFRDRVKKSLEGKVGKVMNDRLTVQCYERDCTRLADIDPANEMLSLPDDWLTVTNLNNETLYFCEQHADPWRDKQPTSSNTVLEVLDELRAILTSKQKDYAGGSDPFKNFKESAHIATIGSGSKITDKQSAFALLGTKISRVGNLESSSSDPQNEPLIDSYRDLAGYAIMLYAMAKEQK